MLNGIREKNISILILCIQIVCNLVPEEYITIVLENRENHFRPTPLVLNVTNAP